MRCKPRERPASICPRLTASIPERKISVAYPPKLTDNPITAAWSALSLIPNAGSEKYILQKLFNHGSLAFSDQEEARLLKIIQSKPTITVINLQRPAVIPGINKFTKALIADFSSQDNVILDLIMGKFKPTGKLPFELPSSME
jgi:hypothetical protein